MEHVLFGGHRGSGCTDSAHARASPARADKPPENTLDSIARAYADGADFVEVDVLRTKDDVLVVTHSNRLADHVLRQAAGGGGRPQAGGAGLVSRMEE